MKKRLFASLIIIFTLCLSSAVVRADKQDMKINGTTYRFDTVDVYVNGEKLRSDAPAAIVNGRTCIPLRAVGESMGARVSWNDKNNEAQISMGSVAVNIVPDNAAMLQKLYCEDGIETKTIKLDVQAFIDENTSRTYIPFRAVSEALFCDVDWDGNSRTVSISQRYDEFYRFREDIAPAKRNDKWGYVNKDGEEIASPQYDYADLFYEGMAVVEKNGKVGYVSNTGVQVVPPKYDAFSQFEDGVAVVGVEVGEDEYKCGCIDKNGNEFIPLEYEYAQGYSEGRFVLKKDGKWGALDVDGNTVIPFEYDEMRHFSDGFSAVKGVVEISFGEYGVGTASGWGFIDLDGNPLSMSPAFEVTYDFLGGYGLVYNHVYGFGLINKEGDVVIPMEYDDIAGIEGVGYFIEGLAAVEKDGKWGYIDENGEYAVKPQYDDVNKFSGGLAAVKKDGKWGYISPKGNTIIAFIYDEARTFSDGFAAVKKDGKYGVINEWGRKVISIEYDNIEHWTAKYAEVEKDGEYYYVDYD